MKNKKGQSIGAVGLVIVGAVGILVAMIFMSASSNNVATFTTTNTVNNQTGLTYPANGSSITLNGQAIVAGTTPIVINKTGTVIAATNYTLRNYQPASAGGYVTTLTSNGNPVDFANQAINVSYQYEPIGYATDGGSRSMGSIVLVFAAILALTAAIVPAFRSGLANMFGL